ncbi:uncharacterized protein Dmul_23350 [Desulfococcus multivorans]|nr:uncharacterized protein Dmul_23350 [Desulfococcus multivorans]
MRSLVKMGYKFAISRREASVGRPVSPKEGTETASPLNRRRKAPVGKTEAIR